MGKLSRNKGAFWERDVARFYVQLGDESAVRELRESQQGLIGDVNLTWPLSIQVKSGARPRLLKGLLEAVVASEEGQLPICHAHIDAAKPFDPSYDIVLLMREDWAEIVKLLVANRIWNRVRKEP